MPRRHETRPVRLEMATPEDAGPLTVVAALAFVDDRKSMPEETLDSILAADDPSKGPPHTSYEWTRKMVEGLSHERKEVDSTFYKIVLGDSRIVGGLLVIVRPDLGEGEWRCEGIYIDPDYQNRGIGQEAFRAMYKLHPDVVRWSLDTPEYAIGNHHFYERMGFAKTGVSDGDPGAPFSFYDYENTLSREERLEL
ncbi:MAG: GNAT family N-acetyltransferase [Candidatus Bipolaricaulia bacterium]